MTLKASSGLRDAMLGDSSFTDAMGAPVLIIYTGTPPATADDAALPTTLVLISDDDTGNQLNFGAAVAGTIPKDPAQVWRGTVSATGTATHWRLVDSSDDGTASSTACRVQGLCGVAASDLNMSNTNLTAGGSQSIDACNFTFPTY